MDRKKKLTFLLVLILSFSIFGIAIIALFGFSQIDIVDHNYDKKEDINISFSISSGFYDEPQYLCISSNKEVDIYYTLDCSTPNKDSLKYEEPIYLDNASLNDNVYSMNTDISAGFYHDLVEKYSTSMQADYKQPDYLIDKCNVVRAIAIDKYGNHSDVISGSFFIGLDKGKYKTNVYSIITNPDNLFDDEIGIYVTGNVFKEALESGYIGGDSLSGRNWKFWPANYREKGKDWRRESYINVFDIDKKIIYEDEANIAIQGGGSRGTIPKNLNLFLRNRDNKLDVLYNFDFSPSKITLSAGGNELITKMNDCIISKALNDELDVATMKFSPSILFLDGEYWGFYWATTSYDENYFEHFYSIDKNNVLMIKNEETELGDEGYYTYYSRMRNQIINYDLSDEKNYKEICKLIDVDSFIDYYSMMIYIARQGDWPNGNTALFRSVEKDNDKYSDGKFRWAVFDVNSLCMKNEFVNHNTLQYVIEKDELFASLWNNSSFRDKFVERIFEIGDTYLSNDKMSRILDEYSNENISYLFEDWKRFYGCNNKKIDEFILTVNDCKAFFNNRRNVVESWFD